MMDAIVVNNVSKSYGRVQALNDVSFAVGKGEVFGLIECHRLELLHCQSRRLLHDIRSAQSV